MVTVTYNSWVIRRSSEWRKWSEYHELNSKFSTGNFLKQSEVSYLLDDLFYLLLHECAFLTIDNYSIVTQACLGIIFTLVKNSINKLKIQKM